MWTAICEHNGCTWQRVAPNRVSADMYAHLHRADTSGHAVIIVPTLEDSTQHDVGIPARRNGKPAG